MATIAQIKNNDSAVKRLARALDAVSWVAATFEGPDHPRWQEYKSARRAYRIALLTPLSRRREAAFKVWLEAHGRRSPFKDLERRTKLAGLRRDIKVAERALEIANLEGTMREQVEAEAALVAAQDSLDFYRSYCPALTPADLDRVIGAS
jgi:hypothetical protein